jgi:hypothetical protein
MATGEATGEWATDLGALILQTGHTKLALGRRRSSPALPPPTSCVAALIFALIDAAAANRTGQDSTQPQHSRARAREGAARSVQCTYTTDRTRRRTRMLRTRREARRWRKQQSQPPGEEKK